MKILEYRDAEEEDEEDVGFFEQLEVLDFRDDLNYKWVQQIWFK